MLAYVEGEPTDNARELMNRAVVELSRREAWSLGPPRYVDEGDDGDWTIGVLLELPLASAELESERRALDDAEAVVSVLERVGDPSLEIAIEMNGEVVGFLVEGRRDDQLQRGLFEPWRERLESVAGP
ncbi:hypothetical protein [Intrasporangium mesophilum]